MPAVMLAVFALTLFCSACLLFFIEPMVGKMMLPLLGGTPAVWNTCMVFFQSILLAGYAFAHWSTKWLGSRAQARLQMGVLLLPFLSFAINAAWYAGLLSPNDKLILGNEGNPIPALLLVLSLSVGLPMAVVCTSAPLLQRWFAATDHPAARDPYFLYGASNLGSIAMLIGYPLLVEPYLTLRNQQLFWVVGYAVLTVLVACCAYLLWTSRPAAEAATEPSAPPAAAPQTELPNAPRSDAVRHAAEPAGRNRKAAEVTRRESEDPILAKTGDFIGNILVAGGYIVVVLGLFLFVGHSSGLYPTFALAGYATMALGGLFIGVGEWRQPAAVRAATVAAPETVSGPVTWGRRIRWITLAVVPSSLMLGVTTYITTDIAAIPLLWVLPLTLYLLTFILVFARISPRAQGLITLAALGTLLIAMVVWVVPMFLRDDTYVWLLRVVGFGILAFSFQILRYPDPQLLHRVMIMAMPLLVLLLIFMILSEIKPNVLANILIHLGTLFAVSMVCHGELARDRPPPSHLTEYFLWMSTGGVIGGLFNALFAPVAFNSLVEYPLMLVVACLLLPPLGVARLDSAWARRADLALAGVFVLVGVLLLVLRWVDTARRPDLTVLKGGEWQWGVAALLLSLALGGLAAWKGWLTPPSTDPSEPPEHWADRVLDVALPFCLMVLVIGLFWGLPASRVEGRLSGFAKLLNMDNREGLKQFRIILTFGLPAVLCYTFVERSLRFGLGVGLMLLASSYLLLIDDSPMFQVRSFFGVLRVEEDKNKTYDGYPFPIHRLVHGTTLHGKQFWVNGEEGGHADYLRNTPLSYYHRTGPVGNVFAAYNTDPKRPVAVIGLGTGTMATYGLPGQTMDFYDIDPRVVDIAFDTDQYFTFVEDAEKRGVGLNLVLGDARLTFEPKGQKKRLRPLHARKGQPRPQRQFGTDIPEDFKYGLIIVDAFSSDAIPIHLITKEAVKIYFDRTLEDGIVLMHISNRYLDLQPVLARVATEMGLVGYHMSDEDQSPAGKNRSHWVALVRKEEYLLRVLTAPRWEREPDLLPLLCTAAYPGVGPAMTQASGLAYALQAVVDVSAREKARKEGRAYNPTVVTDWKPLDTVEELERQLEEALAEERDRAKQLQETPDKTAEEKADAATRRRKKLEESLRTLRRVGVWTDDYSNLMSVFSW